MSFLLSLIATIYLIAGNIYFGYRMKGYSHLKHAISELGETGSAYEKKAGFGLFLPVSILLVISGLLSSNNIPAMGLAFSLAVGYIVAAFFPCDAGSPYSGSWKQQLHNLGGFIEYAGSIIFIMKQEKMTWHCGMFPLKLSAISLSFV